MVMARRRVSVPVDSPTSLDGLTGQDAWLQFFDENEPLSEYWTPENTSAGMARFLRRRAARLRLRNARARVLSQISVRPAGVNAFEFLLAHGLVMSDRGTVRASADATEIYVPVDPSRADPNYLATRIPGVVNQAARPLGKAAR